MNIEELLEKIRTDKNLSTVPVVMTKIINLIYSGSFSLSELAEIVKIDQVLSYKVLNQVNSASFGISHRVISVEEAINLLGMDRVVLLALNTSYIKKEPVEMLNLSEFWKHTISTSSAARYFAKRMGFIDLMELSSTIGLLHDIGKMFLMSEMPEQYLEVIKEIKKSGQISQVVERRILGIDHCQAGLLLVKEWNWPKSFQNLIFYHHYPYKSELVEVSYFVYLANYAAHFVMKDLYPGNYVLDKLIQPIQERVSDLPLITEEIWDGALELIAKELYLWENL